MAKLSMLSAHRINARMWHACLWAHQMCDENEIYRNNAINGRDIKLIAYIRNENQ